MYRVLVVEDDAKQRTMICMILANAGYGVVEAVSVKTALMHLDIMDLSAVVLDLRLPNGHGRKVVEELVSKRDDVPVVVLTGYPEDAPKGFPVTAVLNKPFKRDRLLEAVAEARTASDAIKSMRASTRKLGDIHSS
ncbi:MAG TPA: response regulator [Planctomycetota bacterium]|jgi:DNA-binding NtrC family response regulator|nr:response regulator [Planctomycetota bacterium]